MKAPETAAIGRFTRGTGKGNANVARRIGVVLAQVFHQRDTADGQQDDGAHRYSAAPGDQRMAQFVQHHAAKDDDHQRQSAHGTGWRPWLPTG